MSEVRLRLNSQGTETTTAEVGNGATVSRISPRDAKKIQDFADRNRVEIIVVGSRVDPAKEITAGESDWDYLINEVEGLAPRKNLREIESSAGRFLPRGRQRTDQFGNTRSGLDVERNVPLQAGEPFVRFTPRLPAGEKQ